MSGNLADNRLLLAADVETLYHHLNIFWGIEVSKICWVVGARHICSKGQTQATVRACMCPQQMMVH
jgi:hypothetical protein